ncbi:sodium-dependent transporter [Salinirubrum litoreum]|uniref:Sodium-dependent transporter n=1 Tax=Salinirubrum litoreum TaxID=1126234 RepID=A0ABD5REM5_9EURY|nr:sodium-dependent transporter [Salinirubrum litoreum]
MARETWATRVGFILAAVGSAVGLGNLWRFPWMTAENGGSAFLVVYLAIVLLVGVPGLLAEFVIGRRTNRNPYGAFRALTDSRVWPLVGVFSVLTGVVLLSFYSVVGGWILRYTAASVTGAVGIGAVPYFADPGAFFGAVAVGPDAVVAHLVFLLLTGAVVLGGVRRGIEVGTTLMVPGVAVLLVALAVWAAGQPNAGAGYDFYLRFDPSVLAGDFLGVLGPAAGQALFTLSVGAGTMITYASYLGEDRSLPFDGATVALLNTAVGVLAGLVVFPLLFSQGIDPTAGPTAGGGPGAVFVSLAGAFSTLPAGELVAVAFFGVVSLAALSSSISMLELPVSFLVDEFGVSRPVAVGGLLVLVGVTGSATALDQSLFGVVAGPVVDTMLTLGLTAFLLFVGWVLGRDAVVEFERGAGEFARQLSTPWLLVVGVLLPVFLLFTLFTALGLPGVLASVGLTGTVGVVGTVGLAVLVAVGAFVALRGPESVV